MFWLLNPLNLKSIVPILTISDKTWISKIKIYTRLINTECVCVNCVSNSSFQSGEHRLLLTFSNFNYGQPIATMVVAALQQGVLSIV